jgi:hypothetical protein
MVKADGTAFWVRLTATSQPPLDSLERSDTPMSRVVLTDITEQKQAEQARAALEAKVDRKQAPKRSHAGSKGKGGKAGKPAKKKVSGR